MEVKTTHQETKRQNSALYSLYNKVFSSKSESELLVELDHAEASVNHRVISPKGITYIHPPLYYATIAANKTAIEHLQKAGAKYSELTHDELQQVKKELLDEISFLRDPQAQLELAAHSNSEIAVHIPKQILEGVLPQLIYSEIENRKEILKHIEKSLKTERYVGSESRGLRVKKGPSKKPLLASGANEFQAKHVRFPTR